MCLQAKKKQKKKRIIKKTKLVSLFIEEMAAKKARFKCYFKS